MHFEIEQMSEEFTKYHLKGFPFDAVLHKFSEPDKGLPHDHPFGFTSFVIKGGYVEQIYFKNALGIFERFQIDRRPGQSFYVPADRIHKIIHLPEGECWTMILPGPWERHGGFWDFSKNLQRPEFIPFTPKNQHNGPEYITEGQRQ